MARILMAWELGMNLGHVYPLRWLAQAFSAKGHEVTLVLRETGVQARAIVGADANILPAPTDPPAPENSPPTRNYVDILCRQGFSDPDVLRQRVSLWQVIIDAEEPDLVLTDHAPTAVLAARSVGLPVAVTGIGFLVPPRQSPMPPFLWWQKQSDRLALRRTERAVLAAINTCLSAYGREPLFQVADLLATEVRALLTVPALDDYPERPQPDPYWGLLRHPGGGDSPDWPPGEGPKLLGYLRPDYPALPAMLEALNTLPLRALIYLPRGDKPLPVTPASHVRLHDQPLDLAALAPQCDAAVSYSSIGFVAELLAHGKPLLLAPPFVQHAMIAQRVILASAGVPGEPDWGVSEYRDALTELIESDKLATGAKRIANEIADYPNSEAVVTRVVSECEQAIAASPEVNVR